MGLTPSVNTSDSSYSGHTQLVHEQRNLGKYQVLAELGRGGAASVSLAVARGKGDVCKLIVLKALLPELAEEPTAVAAFIDEAKLAAQLNHPNVVQTFEVGVESGHHVIVMEYLDGQSLSRIMRTASRTETAFPLSIHLHVLIEVLEGLHYAHEMKGYDGRPLMLVHRDVSPQNVIVTYDGQVKILDFGIAKAAITSTHTAAGIMKGKIAYMAPEQMSGTPVDRRADIYSTGCMLWAAAAGQKLWQDTPDIQVVRAVAVGRIPSPRSVNPDCSPELERIVMRALHPDREHRYPTALELQTDLEQFAEGLGTVKSRDLGRYVSRLFADSRAEFTENVEQELAAVLAREKSALGRASFADLLGVLQEAAPGSGADAPSKSGVQNSKVKSRGRMRIIGAIVLVGAVGAFLASAALRQGAQPPKAVAPSPSAGVVSAIRATEIAPPPITKMASVKLDIFPNSAKLTLDGSIQRPGITELTLPINDELHELMADAEGYERLKHSFQVHSQVMMIKLRLDRSPEPKKVRGGIRMRAPTPTPPAPAAANPTPPPATPTSPAKPAGQSCDNPFYVDADGIKRVRPNCR